MTFHRFAAAALGGGLVAFAATSAGACALQTVGELNVDLSQGAPVVDGEINGVAVKIIIDTGAFHTIITRQTAEALGLAGRRLAGGYVTEAIGGGSTENYVTNVRSLKIGTLTATDLPPMLIEGSRNTRLGASMLVGADFLSQFDLELDLGEHMIRLFKAQDCAPGQLVYWNKPYSEAALIPPPGSYDPPQIETEITLNGRRAVAVVDTGASITFVDAGVAAAAGEPPPARPELIGGGLGPAARLAWVDDFASIAIGDESIGHPRLEVEDFGKDFELIEGDSDTRLAHRNSLAPQVLIGDDFLRTHRVMVDFAHHVMSFTYTGGPIFQTAQAAQ